MHKVSAIIICRNEEKHIGECLKSISWCDEIVVVDAFSNDDTIDIAKQFSDKIFQNEWKGFAEQKKFALSKTSNEWIFSIDADERCTPELAEEIKMILSDNSRSESGFEIPRKSFFLNKWIRHGGWYPNYQMRLFKKSSAEVSDRLVHESFVVEGKVSQLKNDLLHYTVTSVESFAEKINKYSSLSALEKYERKKMGYFGMLFLPAIAFIQQFIMKGSFLDGMGGLMVSRFHMITKSLNCMKMWELQNRQG